MKRGMTDNQRYKEYIKSKGRIQDIIDKCTNESNELDIDRACKLAQTMANRIKQEHKALDRYKIASEMGYDEIAEVFFKRGYEIGAVGQMEYRDYKINKSIGLKLF